MTCKSGLLATVALGAWSLASMAHAQAPMPAAAAVSRNSTASAVPRKGGRWPAIRKTLLRAISGPRRPRRPAARRSP